MKLGQKVDIFSITKIDLYLFYLASKTKKIAYNYNHQPLNSLASVSEENNNCSRDLIRKMKERFLSEYDEGTFNSTYDREE